MNRPIKDINLPLTWAPAITPKPRTPWVFNADRVTLVNRVTNQWILGQEKLVIASESDEYHDFRIPEPPVDSDENHDSERPSSDDESNKFDNTEAQLGANSDNLGTGGPN